jgi:hypothetical protein
MVTLTKPEIPNARCPMPVTRLPRLALVKLMQSSNAQNQRQVSGHRRLALGLKLTPGARRNESVQNSLAKAPGLRHVLAPDIRSRARKAGGCSLGAHAGCRKK